MTYLIDHPPVRSQFRSPRRQSPSGVIAVHTAENTPDHVAFDGGAEAVARFIQSRSDPGSYHELVDSDSFVSLVRWTDEAFHDGTGTNPHSFGLSVATRADVWPFAPKAWRDGAVEQAAQRAAAYARWIKAEHGIVIPARRITAAQARVRVPGFVTHAELDPDRRSDPGAGFPWSQFLARYALLTSQPEDDDMSARAEHLIERIHAAMGLSGLSDDDSKVIRGNVVGRVGVIYADALKDDDDVDEAEVAALVLQGLDPAAIAAAIPGSLAAAVVDELHRRTA